MQVGGFMGKEPQMECWLTQSYFTSKEIIFTVINSAGGWKDLLGTVCCVCMKQIQTNKQIAPYCMHSLYQRLHYLFCGVSSLDNQVNRQYTVQKSRAHSRILTLSRNETQRDICVCFTPFTIIYIDITIFPSYGNCMAHTVRPLVKSEG